LYKRGNTFKDNDAVPIISKPNKEEYQKNNNKETKTHPQLTPAVDERTCIPLTLYHPEELQMMS